MGVAVGEGGPHRAKVIGEMRFFDLQSAKKDTDYYGPPRKKR